MKTGEKVRALREKHGDTLEELATKIGITFGALGKIERGTIQAKEERLRDIAKVYNEEPFEVFFEELVPKELQDLGLKYLEYAKQMKDKEMTDEEIQAAIEIVLKFRK